MPRRPRQPLLTDRQWDVLRLVMDGKTNPQIADELHLSTGTVRNHLSRILDKLGADNRTAAVAYALRSGLLPDELESKTPPA